MNGKVNTYVSTYINSLLFTGRIKKTPMERKQWHWSTNYTLHSRMMHTQCKKLIWDFITVWWKTKFGSRVKISIPLLYAVLWSKTRTTFLKLLFRLIYFLQVILSMSDISLSASCQSAVGRSSHCPSTPDTGNQPTAATSSSLPTVVVLRPRQPVRERCRWCRQPPHVFDKHLAL